MFAGRLALLIGLPVPVLAFVEVAPELVRGNPPLTIQIGSRREGCLPGLHFGSRIPGDPSKTLVVDFLPDRLLRKLKNIALIFPGAFVFDQWTCNCDGRQMVFYRSVDDDGSAYSVALIDQGFCFNDGQWDFPDSPLWGLYPRRFVYEKVLGLKSFEPFLSRIESLDPRQLEECIRGIPLEWCLAESTELQRLAEHLYKRRRKVRQAIINAKNSPMRPFPNWR
jgi:hypothetical protein